MQSSAADPGRFAVLMRIEHNARRAETVAALRFVIVNETRGLVPYSQAVLLTGGDDELRAAAVVDLPAVDRTSPFIAWVERAVRPAIAKSGDAVRVLGRQELEEQDREAWLDFSPPQVLLVPLIAPAQGRQGVLWLARQEPWDPAAITILAHLGQTYGHALPALAPRNRVRDAFLSLRGKKRWRYAAPLIGLLMLAPVRLTALAPAEITPQDPAVVTAPMEGVVKRIGVLPNAQVKTGDILVRLEEMEMRNRYEVAERTLAVADAELHKTRQSSFLDPRLQAHVAELEAQVNLRRAERDFALAQLERAVIRADRDGVAVLGDPKEWEGRPVAVGERIMLLADPERVELRIMLPVKDAVALEPKSEVRLFLDTAPLHALAAEVAHAAYEPEWTPEHMPAYRITARLSPEVDTPRIGLRGTAKLHGPRVTLFYYLFRRPMTALRQWLGW